jgi:chorismate dehydratase
MRVGAVSYLNTKPLVYGLAGSAPQVELVFDLPSRLADRLAAGTLDVALIPSVEFFQNPAYTIVSDACIGCRGPVLSVKLLCRKPASQIRTLALDEGSRTSAALTRILLDQRFGIRPQLLPLPIDRDWQTTTADAVLLIGDRAIHAPNDSLAEVWDLGDEWCRWAELPFVFAMWVARAGIDATGLDEVLQSARDNGLAHLDEIAAAEAPVVGLPPERVLSYLRDNLYFFLGPRERRGLQLYYEHAVRMRLAPAGLAFDSKPVGGYAK